MALRLLLPLWPCLRTCLPRAHSVQSLMASEKLPTTWKWKGLVMFELWNYLMKLLQVARQLALMERHRPRRAARRGAEAEPPPS